MLSRALLLALVLALDLYVSASPTVIIRDNLIRVPFAKQINVTDPANILKNDQARAAMLRARGEARASGRLTKDAVVSIGVQNQAVSYVASVSIGSPASAYSLLVDTGSSNTWIGAGRAYVRTSSSVQTIERVSVTYGAGSFSGTEFTDTVSLGTGLTIKAQSIGVATTSQGFEGVDGILGLGPTDLTLDTLSPDMNLQIPTVTDNLFNQGVVTAHEVAVSFEPTDSEINDNGELTFGGTDNSKFTGFITYTPITSTPPANEFWGIDQSVRLGATTILSQTAGIVDTGTTLVLLATDALEKYRKATGAVMDNATGLLRLTASQFANLQSLFFNINGVEFELTANAQAWPRSLNNVIGGTASNVYLIINDVGASSGSGLDFINGFAFIERFYTVFDTANERVGFATTPFTHAMTN